MFFSPDCEARRCVREKGLMHCGCCEQYPCNVFPAEPTEEETRYRIEVEKLMEAYACRTHMDAFRRSSNDMTDK